MDVSENNDVIASSLCKLYLKCFGLLHYCFGEPWPSPLQSVYMFVSKFTDVEMWFTVELIISIKE